MEDILLGIVRELPSTGVLLLTIFYINKQASLMVDILNQHLERISSILEISVKELADKKSDLQEND